MKKRKIRFYDIPTLEKIAKTFLEKYNDSDTLEVNIEYIIEGKLGWEIICAPNLIEDHNIEAYISKDKKIYMDPYLMDYKERKYRFTLAEEVAHHLLHSDVYKECNDLEDHLKVYNAITVKEYKRMDRNVKYLAASILMPADLFEKQAFAIYERVDKNKYKTNEEVLYKVSLELSKVFVVNDFPAKIRFQNLGLDRKLITL
jgi:Zn-dependent peptidase ImmA (M78 family)